MLVNISIKKTFWSDGPGLSFCYTILQTRVVDPIITDSWQVFLIASCKIDCQLLTGL